MGARRLSLIWRPGSRSPRSHRRLGVLMTSYLVRRVWTQGSHSDDGLLDGALPVLALLFIPI